MKKIRKLPLILLLAVAAIFGVFGLAGCSEPEEVDPYHAFELAKYDVTYDIGSDCVISVTEDISVLYLGSDSTGFIRDIPVNNGAQVMDVGVKKLVGSDTEQVYYDVYFDSPSFLSVDIGDRTKKQGKTESYRLTYTYVITNSVVNKNMLPLNPIGTGWGCVINNASVKLIMPDGYLGAECFIGKKGSDARHSFTETTENGRAVIYAQVSSLDKFNGLSFNLNFETGAISNYSDFTPYIFVIAAAVIFLVIIALRFLVFNKDYLTPVVNYEAPDKMDPLLMGKLIDNKVDNEDITSLIYYWAGKGYIKINLDDKNDPVLIRIVQVLPEHCRDYERLLYNSLFARGDAVKTSSLKNSYYKVVAQATAIVNKNTKGLYKGSSVGIAMVFALLGGLLLGLAPFILALTRISAKLTFFEPFAAIIPTFVIFAFSQALKNNQLKLNRNKKLVSGLAIAILCLITGIAYIFLVPSGVLGYLPKALLFTVCCLIFTCSVLLVNRTEKYRRQLNDIVGFKNFIMLAEKDQLEMMLETDPDFYYHILPYAQVLGVTDKWTEKFESITIQPPSWLTGNIVTTYLEFRLLNNLILNSMSIISTGIITRPSSSGLNGFKGGFGGFSGGGFGGGGGRGR